MSHDNSFLKNNFREYDPENSNVAQFISQLLTLKKMDVKMMMTTGIFVSGTEKMTEYNNSFKFRFTLHIYILHSVRRIWIYRLLGGNPLLSSFSSFIFKTSLSSVLI